MPTGPGRLPNIPDSPAAGSKTESVQQPAPEPPKTFTMSISNGVKFNRYVFVDKDGETDIQSEESSLESTPVAKPGKKAPEKEAAPAGSKEEGKPPPAKRDGVKMQAS